MGFGKGYRYLVALCSIRPRLVHRQADVCAQLNAYCSFFPCRSRFFGKELRR